MPRMDSSVCVAPSLALVSVCKATAEALAVSAPRVSVSGIRWCSLCCSAFLGRRNLWRWHLLQHGHLVHDGVRANVLESVWIFHFRCLPSFGIAPALAHFELHRMVVEKLIDRDRAHGRWHSRRSTRRL